MIVVADTNELLRHFRSDTLTEVRHCLLNMDRATLPDAMAAPSLSFDYVRPGDVLYTPTGARSCEKPSLILLRWDDPLLITSSP